MLKITFEKPKFLGGGRQEAPGARNLLEDQSKSRYKYKKKEKPKPWTWRERALVLGILTATLLLSGYFWYKGNGRNLPSAPRLDFGDFGTSQTIELR